MNHVGCFNPTLTIRLDFNNPPPSKNMSSAETKAIFSLIGITGTIGAGKGTVVDYLVSKYGFLHYSVRDFLINCINKRNMPINRDNMCQIANELRSQYGSSYIVDQIYQQALKNGKNCIVESIRTMGEIKSLKQKGPFTLLAVDATQIIRYQRIKQRSSSTDMVTYQEFQNQEMREYNNTDINKQNLAQCIKIADYVIYNNEDLPLLHENIDFVMKNIM